ncbi:MAG: ATP-binding protein [Nitrospina sp.]|jgi:predicted HTH transcriptional regulator|nr:ATP-binding protein [Nitrospina sp.]MBT3415156.1 ATP-binding protein [Nitrospina sp.]MBT3856614.1 ATP-binding protein [Nitrospina sp.]MBT4103573.1 ATP-binding protein [Nitrospina sp.]MBT4388720.1 ATP-binding protein [Nitrospina sp.]
MLEVFNPFNKSFNEVQEGDLEILKELAEGWHVEYKREKTTPQKIAKSIASFANSHGGIYFLGIEHNP